MTRPRRFAENTQVPVDRSRMEIERYLQQQGATAFGTAFDATRALIQFEVKGWRVAMSVPLVTQVRGRDTPVDDKERRRRWRALLATVKAKFIAVESGLVAFEQEFLPYLVKSDGETVYEALRPQLGAVVSCGERLLPGS